jgi:aspartate aminotransferase
MSLDLAPFMGGLKDTSVVGTMAAGLVGSDILRIAGEIRAMEAGGAKICNLTVGDFQPREFAIPTKLRDDIASALAAGETNYPPGDGVPALRQAVQRFYERALGLKYPLEGILIAGGARPVIYGAYRAVLDAGDTVVYPVPSWNNNHYVHMCGARGVSVKTSADRGFMPTLDELRPHLSEARLLALCSPLNPTGTMVDPEELKAISLAVVAENKRRAGTGQKPLVVMFDHIYWVLTLGRVKHVTPVELVPEIAPYVVFVDGISKSLASTGLRVGWAVGAPAIVSRMRDVLGHVGAWAPKAEQVATAKFLDDVATNDVFVNEMRGKVDARLRALHEGFQAMRAAGLPVRSIEPQGAIYLSVQFDLVGRGGITSNEQIRKLLLDKAALAVVPFQAFGLADETGWFRLSVGATSVEEIRQALPRVAEAVRGVAG